MSWELKKLDDCLELITYGFTNPMPDTDTGPWKVTAKDVVNGRIDFSTARHTSEEAFENELTDKSRPIKDDILLTKDGTLGRLAIVHGEKICINQSVALLRVNKDILLPEYLYYLLLTPEFQGKMLADAGGATIKHIYITRVNQLMIPVPSISVQKRIVDVISAYDMYIDNNGKQIKLLEEAAQRLYKEWFVDLRFPGYEDVPVVDSMPEGWKITHGSQLYDIKTGKKDANQAVSDGQYPFFTCSRDDGLKSNEYVYDGRAIIISGNGSYTGLVKRYNGKFDAYQRTYYLSGFEDFMWSFLYCNFKTDFENRFMGGTKGSAIPYITKPDLEKYKMLLPSKEILEKFDAIVSDLFKMVEFLLNQIELTKEARDRLLPKLMSGEIEV